MSPTIRKFRNKIGTVIKKAFVVDKSIDAMTARARTYFYTSGGRHGITGLTMLLLPWMYTGAAFIPIFNLLSTNTWGWVMTIVGLVCSWAAANKNADIARFGIVLSAMVTAVMALGLWIGISFLWFKWFQVVGSSAFWSLVLERPSNYPAYLRSLSSIVPPSPFLPIVMTALVIKDFTMCAQPLRVPLEERVVEVVRPLGV
jgi:hypothetical protein